MAHLPLFNHLFKKFKHSWGTASSSISSLTKQESFRKARFRTSTPKGECFQLTVILRFSFRIEVSNHEPKEVSCSLRNRKKNNELGAEEKPGLSGTGFAVLLTSALLGLCMEMASTLDLIGVVLPICLLKCKSALSRLNPGEVLEVMVQDEEVVESLSMILKQSQDSMESFTKEGDCFRISIRKG
jgi:TusA-related sulfurtransferase